MDSTINCEFIINSMSQPLVDNFDLKLIVSLPAESSFSFYCNDNNITYKTKL